MRMVRIGVKQSQPPRFQIMILETGKQITGCELSLEEAADIHSQLGHYLPPALHDVDCGFSDQIDPGEIGAPQ